MIRNDNIDFDRYILQIPEEDKPVCYCNRCGNGIYAGETMYQIDDGICEKCMRRTYEIEAKEEW